MTTITITFQTDMASMIKKLADLSWDRKNDSYNRCAIVGTKEQWTIASKELRTWKKDATSSEKRSLTAAIRRIELNSEQGEYYQEQLVKIAAHRAACKARREARRAARAK